MDVNEIKLDFDDVLLTPQRSELQSRSDIKLNRIYKFPHTEKQWEGIGIIAFNMDAVGTFQIAKKLAEYNILTAIHKHYSAGQLVDFFTRNISLTNFVFYTVGLKEEDQEKLRVVRSEIQHIYPEFPEKICVDVANGYTQRFIERVKQYRNEYPKAIMMVGNVVTPNMTEELILSGADIVKVGIGSGSCCSTRIKTGVGFPQLSAIQECAKSAHHGKPNGHICSDGGCKNAGDVVKAFAAGADFVMLGGLFAGTDECEGNFTEYDDGTKEFKFYGMSSEEAQNKYNSGLATYRAAEGKCVTIPAKGPVERVVQDILGGIRSACTYVGAAELKDLPRHARFISVTQQYNDIYGRSF